MRPAIILIILGLRWIGPSGPVVADFVDKVGFHRIIRVRFWYENAGAIIHH